MKTKDFFFNLPSNFIAQHPSEKRGESRLMVLHRSTGNRFHRSMSDLPDIICAPEFFSPNGKKPLLVFNDSKVRRARLIGKSKQSGARAEFLLLGTGEQGLGSRDWGLETRGAIWKVLVKRAKRRKSGSSYVFFDNTGNEIANAVLKIDGEELLLEFDKPIDDAWLDCYGHIPLPPYIKREDVSDDAERYQTIYARETGSAAAPTAGLHFTRELFERLNNLGVESVFITLHVGLGTFLPVRGENIEDHRMHEEYFTITEEAAVTIEKAREEDRKIIAVGTTSIRSLESAWTENGLRRGPQSTSIFIYPGFRFKTADAMFTNFHTPESTLLMLVSAFAGRELILESYAEAISLGYRFFSYGDAMLIV
ncbi:MAG: tRNA preQ1(34) S-adenosylmethionine ribosyltransferase-isomerase QueA [Treponema sp.]|nr:tRNA preQ1(34) S-adenosylmethionine ribosyltransferase-isomerase QueA [Treponema sp.]